MIIRIVGIFALALASMLLNCANAYAGAWTLSKYHWQIFTSATASQADGLFGSDGRPGHPTKFSKLLLQNCLEFGLTDRLTLFAIPAFVVANVQTKETKPVSARNSSFEGGARFLLLDSFGVLSVQGSYKTAGAFDLSVSANRQPGRQIDARLLYGTNFSLFDMSGFADFQIGQRWINRPRPNETPVDLTAGLWVTPSTMVMARSFNVISDGDAISPYSYYRAHKIEVSVVEKLSKRWSLKVGAFASPAGQNAIVERGIGVALWTQD